MHTAALIDALKRVLKAKGITYAHLAHSLALSEASIKRMFSRGDFTLQRLEEICRAARVDFAELATEASTESVGTSELSVEQEQEIVSDPALLLVAWCAINHWTFAQIVATYDLTDVECVRCLACLDRLRIIQFLPGNRIKPLISRGFSWRPDGPIQRYFRARVEAEYLGSKFDRNEELFLFVSGMLSSASIADLIAALRQVARDFAQRHRADVALPLDARLGTSLLVAMRPWELRAFRQLRREGETAQPTEPLLTLQKAGAGQRDRKPS